MDGWDHPSNARLIASALGGGDVLGVVGQVALARHDAGFTFGEACRDVLALIDVLPKRAARAINSTDVTVSIGDVYLDLSYSTEEVAPSPTGLPDETYLTQRLKETFRDDRPWHMAAITIQPPEDRFDSLLVSLSVVPLLEQAFAGASSLAALSGNCFVALAVDDGYLAETCSQACERLREQGISASWRLVPRPDSAAGVGDIFRGFRRP